MPPAEPAKKDALTKRAKSTKGAEVRAPKKTALCHTCGARIRIPDGWSVGPAVRRHYWAKHRARMQKDGTR